MLIFENGVYNGGEPEGDADAVRAIIEQYIEDYADWKRVQLAGKPSPAMVYWSIKLAEANAGTGPMLIAEAQERGITLANLCQKVINKAAKLGNQEAKIAGQAGKMKDAIRTMTREQLVEFDWRF